MQHSAALSRVFAVYSVFPPHPRPPRLRRNSLPYSRFLPGGTFSDVHASWPVEGQKERKEIILKLLSSDPGHYKDAPRGAPYSASPRCAIADEHTDVEGVRRVLEIATGSTYKREDRLPVDKIDSIRLSTTVATNALLERKGAKHALVVTKGFKDLLLIGNQSRPRIFDLDIKRPSVLYSTVLEVDERVTLLGYTSDPKHPERAVKFDQAGKVVKGYDGAEHTEGSVVKGMSGEAVHILKKVDEEQVERDLRKLYDDGIRVLAIVLMHAFTYPGASPPSLAYLNPLKRVRKRIC